MKICLLRMGNYLCSSFPIENGLKQADALNPLLYNFAVDYAIRKGIESNLGLNDWHPSGIGLCG